MTLLPFDRPARSVGVRPVNLLGRFRQGSLKALDKGHDALHELLGTDTRHGFLLWATNVQECHASQAATTMNTDTDCCPDC